MTDVPAARALRQLDVAFGAISGQTERAREEAEARMGVSAGDMAVLDDPVYSAVLDAWRALYDAQQRCKEAFSALGAERPLTSPERTRRAP